jgi:peptidoglycan/LPS O-acetylase OafA/YrhL
MTYIKQLDSLRAIAVILVVINHWVPSSHIINKLPNGAIGVDIFFVLSGFLISKILFDSRNNVDLITIPKSVLIKNFYVRRALRIFPIYYLTIFTLLFFSKSTGTDIASSFVYFATYTSNFYFFNIKDWDGMISHLWSLAVEEQFYLIWPGIIFYTKKKYFIYVISGVILIGILSQYLLQNVEMSTLLTFTCFHAFGFWNTPGMANNFCESELKKILLNCFHFFNYCGFLFYTRGKTTGMVFYTAENNSFSRYGMVNYLYSYKL